MSLDTAEDLFKVHYSTSQVLADMIGPVKQVKTKRQPVNGPWMSNTILRCSSNATAKQIPLDHLSWVKHKRDTRPIVPRKMHTGQYASLTNLPHRLWRITSSILGAFDTWSTFPSYRRCSSSSKRKIIPFIMQQVAHQPSRTESHQQHCSQSLSNAHLIPSTRLSSLLNWSPVHRSQFQLRSLNSFYTKCYCLPLIPRHDHHSSDAFNTVNHNSLLERLCMSFIILGAAVLGQLLRLP